MRQGTEQGGVCLYLEGEGSSWRILRQGVTQYADIEKLQVAAWIVQIG